MSRSSSSSGSCSPVAVASDRSDPESRRPDVRENRETRDKRNRSRSRNRSEGKTTTPDTEITGGGGRGQGRGRGREIVGGDGGTGRVIDIAIRIRTGKKSWHKRR